MGELSARLVLASNLSRLVAVVIDWLLVFIVLMMLTSFGLARFTDTGWPRDAQTIIVIFVAAAAYHAIYLAWRSATPGKMAMRIYVAYPDGAKIRVDTAILRSIFQMFTVPTPVVALVDGVFALFDSERRALHDRVAGTVVLRGRPEAPLREQVEESNQ